MAAAKFCSQDDEESTVGFGPSSKINDHYWGAGSSAEHLHRQQHIDEQYNKLFEPAKTDKQQPVEERKRSVLQSMAKWGLLIIMIDLVIYNWPIEGPEVEPKVADARPRPTFTGPLAINERLDEAELLFKQQFNAPESMAWQADKRAFYTGVEGGFIVRVEPQSQRWSVVARLNARDSVRDLTPTSTDNSTNKVPYCTKDADLYGAEAETTPSVVQISRCSRPLGIRLAPQDTGSNASYLYVSDPLSGLYRVDLSRADHSAQVSKLLDFSAHQNATDQAEAGGPQRVLFADDIAVDWGAGTSGADVIYLTDCSQRWTLRYLTRLMVENDDSGRVLRYDTGAPGRLTVLDTVVPVVEEVAREQFTIDTRKLSFPNGVELSANKSALLISDLNNRRILLHHLRGPLKGATQLLLWAPGYSDNIRRGLDLADGRPTYWAACGCAVSDGWFEPAELTNNWPRLRKLVLKTMHLFGSGLQQLGSLLRWTRLQDAGLMFRAIWLKVDPYCAHGLVFQFTEQGEILRSLHAPHFRSHFKLISEAHEVAAPEGGNQSILYLGSVYYSYLGRLSLSRLTAA